MFPCFLAAQRPSSSDLLQCFADFECGEHIVIDIHRLRNAFQIQFARMSHRVLINAVLVRNDRHPNVTFTFLGFLFRPRRMMTRSGQLSTSFLPGVSRDALKRMRQKVRGWQLPRQTVRSLVELAEQCNPTIRGWWNYYGAFYRTAMNGLGRYLDRTLARWTRCKYKTLGRHKRRSEEWLHKMRKAYPRQFVHWQFLGVKVG